ncbi:hypothetical protein BC749_1197 [Flavobacterium araucananum]|nr:hypothetical protein BC749_1197 [Flavobacterium araucananum]
MSIDPLAEKYQYQSPYNFSENRVVDSRELEGLEKVSVTKEDEDIEPGSFKYEVGMFILNLIGGVGELGAKVDGVQTNSVVYQIRCFYILAI